MELMEGGELFEKIRNHVRFTEKEAQEVAKQVRFVSQDLGINKT